MRLLHLALLTSLVCATPAIAQHTPAQDLPAYADALAMVEHIEEVATIIHAHERDCAAMAQALATYHQQIAHELNARQTRLQKVQGPDEHALARHFQPRLQAAALLLEPGLRQCAQEPAVSDAMRRLSSPTPAKSAPETSSQVSPAWQGFCEQWLQAAQQPDRECSAIAADLQRVFDLPEHQDLLRSYRASALPLPHPCTDALALTLFCAKNPDVAAIIDTLRPQSQGTP